MTAPEDQTANSCQRPAEYPFTNWNRKLEEAVGKLRGRPRHCALNATRCLRRSWLIAPLDPEMALFRAITAEEEAATALILALQQKRYPGASNLKHHSHPHKAGLTTFLRVIERFLAEVKFPVAQVTLKSDGQVPRIDVGISVPGGLVAMLDEPLNGITHEEEDAGHIILNFSEQSQKYAAERGAADMLTAIRSEANIRNQLLYASDEGIAVAEDVDPALIARRRPVFILLALTVMILQTPMHQLFAVQVLRSYLLALKAIPEDAFDYEAALTKARRP